MHPPPDAGATIYRYGRTPAGHGRITLAWVKHTVRAVVDRESTIFEGRSDNPVDAYRLVVRKWSIKRGWIYEVWSECDFSDLVESGSVVVSNEKPRAVPGHEAAS